MKFVQIAVFEKICSKLMFYIDTYKSTVYNEIEDGKISSK